MMPLYCDTGGLPELSCARLGDHGHFISVGSSVGMAKGVPSAHCTQCTARIARNVRSARPAQYARTASDLPCQISTESRTETRVLTLGTF